MNAVDGILGPPLAAGRAEAPALLCGTGSVSYGALDRRVAQAAYVLRSLGLDRENRALLLLRDSPSFVALWLGALSIGAVPVAVTTRALPEELAFYLRDSRARLFLVDPEFIDTARAALALLPEEEEPGLLRVSDPLDPAHVDASWAEAVPDFGTLAVGAPEIPLRAEVAPDDMAFWLYTSGTTGAPKAAVHTHGCVGYADRGMREALEVLPGERVFSVSKLFFAYGLGHGLIGALRCGATSILMPEWPTAAAVANQVANHGPQHLFAVPTIYRNILREGLAHAPGFATVRNYVSAGEAMPLALHRAWQGATGRPVIEGLGATETVFLALMNRPRHYRPGSCGKPGPGVEAVLRDEVGNPIEEPGRAGHLHLRMPSVADRYWNRQEASRRAFRGGWFATGDMVATDADGFYWHRGRIDDMLKISGQWVSPSEIEDVAAEHDGVREAAAVGVPDGDGLMRLALFVVPEAAALRAGAGDDAAARAQFAQNLRSHLLARLAVYKCPKTIQLIPEMPRTTTGKLKRFELRARIVAAAPLSAPAA